jgi:hypothetical protein
LRLKPSLRHREQGSRPSAVPILHRSDAPTKVLLLANIGEKLLAPRAITNCFDPYAEHMLIDYGKRVEILGAQVEEQWD